MARLGGLEPPTPGFGGRCSNPLSYRRNKDSVKHLAFSSQSKKLTAYG